MTLQIFKIKTFNDKNVQDGIKSCMFFLVDSEIEKARLKVFNYTLETLSTKIVEEKLVHTFKKLNWAAKVNLAFGLIVKNLEDERFRFFSHTKTIYCWIGQKLCAPGKTWRS